MTYRGPNRRKRDPYKLGDERPWTVGDHRHFEAGLTDELEGIHNEMRGLREDVIKLGGRLAYLAGALAIAAVIAASAVSAILARVLGG